MTIRKINDHRIDVPRGVRVHTETGFPGAYDSLFYRGFELCTFEEGKHRDGLYIGPFMFGPEGEDFIDQTPTLAAAMNKIDKLTEKKPIDCEKHADAIERTAKRYGEMNRIMVCDDREMHNMIRKDVCALMTIARNVRKGNIGRARHLCIKLDTIVRDQLPLTVFNFIYR